jgi:FkbM family methyltransferase
MSLQTFLRRFAAAVLPARPLQALRTLWHRGQTIDPRRLRLQRVHRRLNAGAVADEMVLRPGLRLTIDPQARESFEWFCFRSPEMVRELDGFLAQSAGCRRLLDVGACHGLFALAFTQGRPDAAALAIEPSPLAWEILEANVRSNPGARVTPVQTAVGAAPGVLRMSYSWHHLEAAPETAETAPTAGSPEMLSIPLRTLDSLREERAFRPDVMKVDVEGYEIAVLRGAGRILSEDRPILFLEVHPQRIRELGGSLRELGDLLGGYGYRLFDLHGAPLDSRRFAGLDATARLYCAPPQAV